MDQEQFRKRLNATRQPDPRLVAINHPRPAHKVYYHNHDTWHLIPLEHQELLAILELLELCLDLDDYPPAISPLGTGEARAQRVCALYQYLLSRQHD